MQSKSMTTCHWGLQTFGSMFKQKFRYRCISVHAQISIKMESFSVHAWSEGPTASSCATFMQGFGSAWDEIIVPSDDSHDEAVPWDLIMISFTKSFSYGCQNSEGIYLSSEDLALPSTFRAARWLNPLCIWIIYQMNKLICAEWRAGLLRCSNAHTMEWKLGKWGKQTHNCGTQCHLLGWIKAVVAMSETQESREYRAASNSWVRMSRSV